MYYECIFNYRHTLNRLYFPLKRMVDRISNLSNRNSIQILSYTPNLRLTLNFLQPFKLMIGKGRKIFFLFSRKTN